MADIIAISTVAGAIGAMAATQIRNHMHRRWADDESIHALRASFSGDVLTPVSPDYEREKAVFNKSPSNAPSIIFLPVNTTDVQTAIVFSREFEKVNADLPRTVVRGGGYSYSGLTASNGGCVIDLKRMHAVSVDPSSRTCWVEGGATAKDLDEALDEHGLCTVTGPFSHLGVGGFTTGGGYGLLTYKYGLLMDNLVEAEVALASGEVVMCSENDHPALFWAVRGGGKWIGCVTRFKFNVFPRPDPEVVSAVVSFPVYAWEKVLRACDKRQSEAFNYAFAILSHPVLVGVTVCTVRAVFFDGAENAHRTFKEIVDEIGVLPLTGEDEHVLHQVAWPKANRALDHMAPWETPMYTQNFNISGDRRLEDVVHFMEVVLKKKLPNIIITLDHLNGPGFIRDETSRAKTMWEDRAPFFCGMFLCLLSESEHDQTKEVATMFVKALMDKTSGLRITPKMMNADEHGSIAHVYGENVAEKFGWVKQKYDPEGFFSR